MNNMEVVNRRCAGLDVHKKSISACVLITGGVGDQHATEAKVRQNSPAPLWFEREFFGSSGRTRTYNPSVNSQEGPDRSDDTG
jgi:hypothetical protein